ncbi:histidinol dehydrogenase [Candidatus Woesearchaeota archaeon]|nr:histidinol dehydrogenase [Candidatus Woesearchaeota archaeon]
MISVIDSKDKGKIQEITKRASGNFDLVLNLVLPIINDVKTKGDKALIDYAKKFDKVQLKSIKVSKNEIKEAYKKVNKKTITALKKAAKNIERYARLQLPKEWSKEVEKGITVGQIVRPLERVGCYVPCGNFPLPSTVLMTAIPAKVAGVKEIVVCTPPGRNNESILVAADVIGVKEIYKVGGAQAIAAMAYGTESISKVDKIVGPGNIYVTAAKKLVYGDVGIDFIAGPSEIMIVADKGNAEFIAADMLSQAEHDKLASAILVTTNKKLASGVKNQLKIQLNQLKTRKIAEESLKNYGAIIISGTIDEAFKIVNDLAPEHLEIEDEKWLPKVKNAGAVFIGEYSVEAAGDYCSGPNHVLPTRGFAKARAGLSVLDFVKMPTVQKLTKDGLKGLKDTIISLADVEGLEAHKKSVEKRIKQQNSTQVKS